MLPKFENANVGPITDYIMLNNSAIPNSFYANKFCLLYVDAPLQRALWRAMASRRAVEAQCRRETAIVHAITSQINFEQHATDMAKPYSTQGD